MPPRCRRDRRPPAPLCVADEPPPSPLCHNEPFLSPLPPLSPSGLSFRRQVMQLEGCERAVRPGKRGNLPVELAPRHAPRRRNIPPASPSLCAEPPGRHCATPSLPRRHRASPVAAPCRRLASPFAVLDRVPLHRRCAGPSTLQRPETVAGTHRDATTSATMPVVAGELHVVSDAVVDPRQAQFGVSRRRAWASAQ